MNKITSKSTANTDLKKAEELMQLIAQITVNKKQLQDTIANELKAYNEGLKKYEVELLEIANRNRDHFNADGNFVLEHGYVHEVSNTVVVTTKKFDAMKFQAERPDMIDLLKALKTAPIKKAFLDKDERKELKALGIDITTDKNLTVVPDTSKL
jgi:hypothetical protein